MTTATQPAPAAPRWKLVLLQLIFAYLVATRLWFDLTVTPMGDEAYYWMWGQHLSWSYFDHPPLDGWLQGAIAAVFGWSNFSVRLLTWLTLGGTLWIFWLWSKRLAPDDREGWFWHTAILYLTIPVIQIVAGIAFHDHLLVFLVIASIYAFHSFASDWENGERRWGKLYLSAALLGLAVLTKYNGVFLGLGFAIWILARPKLRPLFLTPHLWLAALLAIGLQAPVFYWNLTEGMASFRFHLSDRPNANWQTPRPAQAVAFLTTLPLVLSPALFLALFRLPWLKPHSPDEARTIGLAGVIFSSSTLCWIAIAAYVDVFFYWNVVAYVAIAPILYRLLGGRIGFWLHAAVGLFIGGILFLTYTHTPLKVLGLGDPGAPMNYGWPQLAARVSAEHAAHAGSFLGATRYTYAAQLGFELHDIDVAAFNPVPSQNDYWWNAAAHAGRDAVIVADTAFPIDAARARFKSLEKLEIVPVVDTTGKAIWTFEIWLGRSYVAN